MRGDLYDPDLFMSFSRKGSVNKCIVICHDAVIRLLRPRQATDIRAHLSHKADVKYGDVITIQCGEFLLNKTLQITTCARNSHIKEEASAGLRVLHFAIPVVDHWRPPAPAQHGWTGLVSCDEDDDAAICDMREQPTKRHPQRLRPLQHH